MVTEVDSVVAAVDPVVTEVDPVLTEVRSEVTEINPVVAEVDSNNSVVPSSAPNQNCYLPPPPVPSQAPVEVPVPDYYQVNGIGPWVHDPCVRCAQCGGGWSSTSWPATGRCAAVNAASGIEGSQ